MREIKFRAWDGFRMTLGRMFFNNTTGVLQGDDVTIMQYTGLKDKNGKEIYEGDIVATEEDNRFPVLFSSKLGAWVVEADRELGLAERIADESWFRFEIIGNIYENADLLK